MFMLIILFFIAVILVAALFVLNANIFAAEFWPKKEVLYQHVHTLYGIIGTFIGAYIFNGAWFSACIGIIIGLCVESQQYFIQRDPLHLDDRLRDLFFWNLGGIIGFTFYLL